MSMKKFSQSMFDELKGVMAEQRSGSSFKNILKTTVGNNYIVRLIPDLNNVSNTIFHYFVHGWKSLATGQFVSCVCPTSIGNRCSICEARAKLYREEDEKSKQNANLLGRKEQWLVNVYVIDDPTNKENKNTIKVLRYGKQLDKVIRDATEGVDKDEFGVRVFDLSDQGCSLRIAVEKNDGGYPTYTSSKFLRESKIEGLTDENVEKTYENLFPLAKMFEVKSSDEVTELLNTHFYCTVTNKENEYAGSVPNNDSIDDVSEVEAAEEAAINKDVESKNIDDATQLKLNELMKDL